MKQRLLRWLIAMEAPLTYVAILLFYTLLILLVTGCSNCWQIPGGCPTAPKPLRPCVGTWSADSLDTCRGEG